MLERAALLRSARRSGTGVAARSDHAGGRAVFQRFNPGRRRFRPFAEAIRTSGASEIWEAARAGGAFVSAGGKKSGAVWRRETRPGSRALSRNAFALSACRGIQWQESVD